MPIYEYRCTACGMEKEFLQKISDPLHTTCPACGKEALTKKLTAAGFQLKGSGWYVTDFRNNGAAPTTKDASKDASKDAKTGGEKSPDGAGADSSGGADKSGDAKTEAKESKSASPAPSTGTAGAGGGSSTGSGSASSSTG